MIDAQTPEHASRQRIRCRWLRRGAICKRSEPTGKLELNQDSPRRG